MISITEYERLCDSDDNEFMEYGKIEQEILTSVPYNDSKLIIMPGILYSNNIPDDQRAIIEIMQTGVGTTNSFVLLSVKNPEIIWEKYSTLELSKGILDIVYPILEQNWYTVIDLINEQICDMYNREYYLSYDIRIADYYRLV